VVGNVGALARVPYKRGNVYVVPFLGEMVPGSRFEAPLEDYGER
jgi:hypothetical protein